MIIILIIAWVVTLGTSLGQYFKSGNGDFSGCIGVFLSIVISVTLTLVMEKSSQKAYEKLSRIYADISVKVLRDGVIDTIKQADLVVGDIVLVESGSKICADGVLLAVENLSVDESALTGESREVHKGETNNVYSGTFVLNGYGKYVVTAVGKSAEIGKIAEGLYGQDELSPLSVKLAKLGKYVTFIGGIMSAIVFMLTVIKLFLTKSFTFDGVGQAFISSVILIVAVVPEGLPTTVAVSLALNMTRLAKQKVLIKKLTASETAGAVSVVCTDKTGTLTENKMTVDKICFYDNCSGVKEYYNEYVLKNFCLNTTAELIKQGGGYKRIGSATECALLEANEVSGNPSYVQMRKKYKVVDRLPFSSSIKYMSTTVSDGVQNITFYKGAPEVLLPKCTLQEDNKHRVLNEISKQEKKGRRVLLFAHKIDEGVLNYDGFVAIIDKVRKESFGAVEKLKNAGIDVKMLTGDNIQTAVEIAKEVGICDGKKGVYTATEIDAFDERELDRVVKEVKVVARSTPTTKLRLVKALKRRGEVVAVTGDGMNDAPAIKNADIGIAMGISGSEISREAADMVLLDDNFSSIVTAIAFGRRLYANIQRFITFQLTVNFSAVALVVISLLLGLQAPFNALQLLWINIIMDGPPALSLGLNNSNSGLLDRKPIKKDANILTKSMCIRIFLQGVFCAVVCIVQARFNLLNVSIKELSGSVFALFVTMQMFNAFNCIEIGKKSVFKSLKCNKIMLTVCLITVVLQIIISTFGSAIFSTKPLSLLTWLKIIALSLLTIIVSEGYKLCYRLFFNKKRVKRPTSLINNV